MRRTVQAFSLIEVLVVIAIIALLAAILEPVLAHSKRSALVVKQKSNLHQLWVAFTLYRDDWDPAGYATLAEIGLPNFDELVALPFPLSPRDLAMWKCACNPPKINGYTPLLLDYCPGISANNHYRDGTTFLSVHGPQFGERYPLLGTDGCTDITRLSDSPFVTWRRLSVDLGGQLRDHQSKDKESVNAYFPDS